MIDQSGFFLLINDDRPNLAGSDEEPVTDKLFGGLE